VNEKSSGRAFADAGKGVKSSGHYEPPAVERMGSLAELTQTATMPNSGYGNPWSA
jgi:hypothetical protein